MRLGDVRQQSIRHMLGNRCAQSITLAINAADAATFKSTGTIAYTVDGVFKSKAALSAQAFSSGHLRQPASTTVYYLVTLDGSGNVKTYQGAMMLSGSFRTTGLPTPPEGETPIGIIKITTNGSTTFTPGTTALDASGVTAAYTNIAVVPNASP